MEFGVVKLVNGLDPASVRCSICSTTPAGDLRRSVAPRVPVYELRRREGNDVRLLWDLCRLFRRERPDVVHTHAWGTLLEGLVAARMARVPVIVHGEHGTLQLKAHQRVLQRWGWGSVDRLLSVSSRLAERIVETTGFSLARITTIRNGVDLTRFSGDNRVQARQSLGISAGSVTIATLGRLVEVKDHVTLLEALAIVRRQGHECLALIAGDGPLRQALTERAAALDLDGTVRFLGHRADAEAVLAAADVFVLSSRSEGLSNTILEAMASGLPVVATRVGGADEMVEDGATGMLVPPGNPEALAAAIAALIGDADLRRRLGRAARARAERDFSLEGMLRGYETLYVESLRAKGRQPRPVAEALVQ
jgi:sugar transferase (PEP-CTERM/EpsH1 system associated)